MKKFCIIAVDYEHHVPRTPLDKLTKDEDIATGSLMESLSVTSIHKGLKSFSEQSYKDFNLVICHDGPKEKTYKEEGIDFKKLNLDPIFINTPERMNDWGHSSRDFALKYAYENQLGEYFIIINIDNVLYSNALEEISKSVSDNKDCSLFVYNIIQSKARDGYTNKEFWFPNLLRGVPVRFGGIDAMQLVAHRNFWKSINFWYDNSQMSDGIIYQTHVANKNYKEIFKVLGINY